MCKVDTKNFLPVVYYNPINPLWETNFRTHFDARILDNLKLDLVFLKQVPRQIPMNHLENEELIDQ